MAQEVACPRCGARREWSGNPWRPFCSERCRLIDLGAWANEEYRIPAPPEPPKDSEPDGS
jgi:hypothetical protein